MNVKCRLPVSINLVGYIHITYIRYCACMEENRSEKDQAALDLIKCP